MKSQEYFVSEPSQFKAVIEHLLSLPTERERATVVTLCGDLGAGKTTFTQQLAAYLGITETVVSPTFVIMKSYDIIDHSDFDQLVHIDAYRFEDESEAGPLRLSELCKTPRTLICLEWPDRVSSIIPSVHHAVSIEITENETRRVTVT